MEKSDVIEDCYYYVNKNNYNILSSLKRLVEQPVGKQPVEEDNYETSTRLLIEQTSRQIFLIKLDDPFVYTLTERHGTIWSITRRIAAYSILKYPAIKNNVDFIMLVTDYRENESDKCAMIGLLYALRNEIVVNDKDSLKISVRYLEVHASIDLTKFGKTLIRFEAFKVPFRLNEQKVQLY